MSKPGEEEEEEEEEEDANPSSGSSNGALWAARMNIETCLGLVLALQEAARKLLGMLRGSTLFTAHLLSSQRFHVSELRKELGVALGLGAVGANVPQDDSLILSLVGLPKGKRLLARAVPMLNPAEKCGACAVGLRCLPYFVASDITGKDAQDAEAADLALGTALGDWVKTAAPTVTSAEGALAGNLALCASWVTILNKAHNGVKLRALLGHPVASAVISSLLCRGEDCAKDAEGELPRLETLIVEDGGSTVNSASTAKVVAKELKEALQAWRAATEALGSSYMNSSD